MAFAVTQLVETVHYEMKGRGFYSQRCPTGLTMAMWRTQPLTGINAKNVSWIVKEAGAQG
jgi:hypothetical protein